MFMVLAILRIDFFEIENVNFIPLSVIVLVGVVLLMSIFTSKLFHKWANKEGLTDESLRKADKKMEEALIDADLGGHVYKKRVAIEGHGKSGGLRTILAFKVGNNSFFMYGFAKNKRANISVKEIKALKIMAKGLLGYSTLQLNKAIKAGSLIEVENYER